MNPLFSPIILMIEIFGFGIPEALFYAGIIGFSIFYVGTLYILLQIMRRKMPNRVFKLTLGQGLMSFKATADDLKVYWKEGLGGKLHEAWKLTKERLMPHWGVSNQIFLVREDYDMTIPFAKVYPKVATKLLCRTCQKIALDDVANATALIMGMTKKKTEKDKKGQTIEYIETPLIDISKLCSNCKGLFYTLSQRDLKEYLCEPCLSKLPDAITIDFATTDELRGSSTEAHSRRKNEDFVRTVAHESRKIRKSDIFYGLFIGLPLGAMIMLGISIMTGVIKVI